MGIPFVQFGNVRLFAGWSMTYTGGQEASTCTIHTVPHLDHLESHGTLVLGEEGNGSLTLHNCVLETPSLNEDRTWELPIKDRRWRWKFGVISGSYNIPRADKTFIREKTPQELAGLLLVAMGEQDGAWDIGRLPNFARPEVVWDADNPASALDELVSSLGCAWTLDLFQDRVVVWPVGQGLDLPDGPTISRSLGLSAQAKPDVVWAMSAPVLWQVRFATEQIGRDTDGKFKPLAQLSFDPLDDDDPEDFSNIDEDAVYLEAGEPKKIIDLAKEWCFKTSRITGIAKVNATIYHNEPLPVDGWSPDNLKGTDEEPKAFQDILLQSHRAEQLLIEDESDPQNQGHWRKVDKDVALVARWYDSENEITPQMPKLYLGHVDVDEKFGLIRTADPLYLIGIKDGLSHTDPAAVTVALPAEVFVDIAFVAGRDGRIVRHYRYTNTGERNDTGPHVIKREDVECRIVQHYGFEQVGNTSYRVTQQETTIEPDDVDQQLQYYIDAAMTEFDLMPSITRHYYHLWPFVPDGRIRQVTWSGGGGNAATTQVSLATEHNPWIPTIDDQRQRREGHRQVKEGKTNRRKTFQRLANE